MFDLVSGGLSGQAFAAALAVTLFAGFVKGAVGFAMPMILVSAFAIFLPQHLALAGLILPTLVTNLSQAFRQGVRVWPSGGCASRFVGGCRGPLAGFGSGPRWW